MFFLAGLMRRWWQLSWNGASPLVKIGCSHCSGMNPKSCSLQFPVGMRWVSSQYKVLHQGRCGLLQEAQRTRQDSCMQCAMDGQQPQKRTLFVCQIRGRKMQKRTFFCFPSLGKTSTVQSGISTLSTSKTWRAERSWMKRWKNILKEPRHRFLHHFPHLILSDVHII